MVHSTSGESLKRRKGYAANFRRGFQRFAAPPSATRVAPRLTRAEERALVEAARGGDRRALSTLLMRLAGPVHSYGRVFCRDPRDAEDVTQTVLMALVRTLREFRGESSLTTWTYSVARRACARQRRRRAGEPTRFAALDGERAGGGALEVEDRSQDPERSWERTRMADAIGTAIRALPPAQREVLVLRDVEGLSAAEVGRALRLTEDVVKARLHRARITLRGALRPWAPEPSRRPAAARAQAEPTAAAGNRCRDTVRLISRYLEGDLSEASCADLHRHVESCRECGAACKALRQVLGACRRLRGSPPRVRATARAALRRLLAGV